MKRLLIILLLVLTFGLGAYGQPLDEGNLLTTEGLPEIRINDEAGSLQRSLYPKLYITRSLRSDVAWVRRNDSTLLQFWQEVKDSTLLTMTELSGIGWVEEDITLYLLRFYPTEGSASPLVLPLGGIRRGILTEAAPTGSSLKLNLIYQLARRNLTQAVLPGSLSPGSLSGHPLMRDGKYRRDNLAMLLALVTAQKILGLDSTYDAYQSSFWRERFPGRQILQEYLLGEWILTSERPLAQWIIDEPYTSQLVSATRPPRKTRKPRTALPGSWVEGLPVKGRLGFSVKPNNSGQLVVNLIDLYRLAYASGLREGDVVKRVNEVRPRNQKDLIERILENLDSGGAILQVTRDNALETVIIEPMDLPLFEDDAVWDQYDDPWTVDSTLIDSAEAEDFQE